MNGKVTQAIEEARSECNFPKKAKKHRRGNFPALAVGISYGGGQRVCLYNTFAYPSNSQQKPGNLCHSDANAAALSKLVSNDAVKKVAGFASGKPFILLPPSLPKLNIN